MITEIPVQLSDGRQAKILMAIEVVVLGKVPERQTVQVPDVSPEHYGKPKYAPKHYTALRLTEDEVRRARLWLDTSEKNMPEQERKVLRVYFPKGSSRMADTEKVMVGVEALGLKVDKARQMRNSLLRTAGVLMRE